MKQPQFCDDCDVSLDLHDGPDSCEYAEHMARRYEMVSGFLGRLGSAR